MHGMLLFTQTTRLVWGSVRQVFGMWVYEEVSLWVSLHCWGPFGQALALMGQCLTQRHGGVGEGFGGFAPTVLFGWACMSIRTSLHAPLRCCFYAHVSPWA
jgi:hypothetical protein